MTARLPDRLAFYAAVMSTVAACLFVSGSACFFPELDLYNEGITQFTVGCCIFWISSCVQIALRCQCQLQWKRNREALEPAIVLENVGGVVMIVACILLYKQVPEVYVTIGMSLFAAGCVLCAISPICGVFKMQRNSSRGSSHFFIQSVMFAFSIIGNGILFVGCILFLPTFDKEIVAVYVFLLGSVFLLAAELIHLIQAWTAQHVKRHIEIF